MAKKKVVKKEEVKEVKSPKVEVVKPKVSDKRKALVEKYYRK